MGKDRYKIMLVLERITGSKAYIYDDENLVTADISEIDNCQVGDVLIWSGEKYITDKENTVMRRKQLSELKKSLMK